MKRLISIIAIMIVTDAFAANPETRDDATSQYYVETQLSNRQDTIPAKNGDKAVTPTGTKGQIGERDVKTTLGDETNNQSDTGITTVATVNTAIGNKQNMLRELPAGVNVVTYTGTGTTPNNGGAGVVAPTPIYDKTTNTYGNGLVRAETLNEAVATGVSNVFTQIDENGNESNNGGLWRINAFTNPLPTTIYAQATDVPLGQCYREMDPTNYPDSRGACTATLFDDMARGDWAIIMPNQTGITYNGTCTGTHCGKEIRGISACSNQTFTGMVKYSTAPDSLSPALQTAYENGRTDATSSGVGCYCKVTNPHIGVATVASPWVYTTNYSGGNGCAKSCAHTCSYYAITYIYMRTALFGGVSTN